jgi:hypothetical protein
MICNGCEVMKGKHSENGENVRCKEIKDDYCSYIQVAVIQGWYLKNGCTMFV